MLQCSLPTASHYPVVVWGSVGVGECWCGRVLVWESVGVTSVSEEHGDGEGSGE